jgi:exonuclease SbcC
MIPVKIELKNFLAYAEPDPIDFTGLHVACLVGPNGAGKSSLLDAITWALWGKARASHDDLVRLGESEMQVRLTYAFGKNTYRVTRFRSKEGRGSSQLVLEISDGDRWQTISEPTIRATQRKINRILRLDYDTFINSAFLAQGRADEFTSAMRPSERKELLGEILNLNAWSTYEDRAKATIKELDMNIGQTDESIKTIDAELALEADYQRELISAQEEAEAIRDQRDEVNARYQEAKALNSERQTVQVKYEAVTAKITRLEADLERNAADQDERHKRADQLADLLEREQDITAGYATLQEARQQEAAMSDRLKAHSNLREALSTLNQRIEQERMRIQADLRTSTQRLEDIQQELAQAPTDEDFAEVEQQIAALEALEEQRVTYAEEQAASKEESVRIQATNKALKNEMNALKQQQNTLKAAEAAQCPTCGQALSQEDRQSLISELQAAGETKAETYRANQEQIAAYDEHIAECEQAIKQLGPEIKQLAPLRSRRETLHTHYERAEGRREEAEQLAEQVATYKEQLDKERFAAEAREERASLQTELNELGYDEAQHEELRATIKAHEDYDRQKAQLDNALDVLPEIKDALAALNTHREELLSEHEQAAAEAEELERQLAELDDQLTDFETLERELDRLHEEFGTAKVKVGAAEQKVKALEDSRQRRDVLIERRNELAEQKGIYADLRQAFGKDGVPAMVIETAIPEIEQEANQLLGRMTDGRMHVRFDTQREKKSGGAMETLDIRIADELGTRDYATFSGGESFRVNFAIRLALSRLLARRAGAQLRTLIIDEGFGTQDAHGRERLVQAINIVQEEFDLLLVITHIDELKDAFPARIEVTKLSDGSVVEII